MATIVGLDLGSTRIKAGRLDSEGRISNLVSEDAPPVTRTGLRVEGDAGAYVEAARHALSKIMEKEEAVSLGITSQRSTFLLWDRVSGKPMTPLISWQDRRASEWCDTRRAEEPQIIEDTGLVLSPHYAGPKLAYVCAQHPQWTRRLEAGDWLFGTLDTYVVWCLSKGQVYRTDLTMAARTLMVNLDSGQWNTKRLEAWGLPCSGWPEIGPSAGFTERLTECITLTAMVGDQPSGMAVALSGAQDTAWVNLGTGGFVLFPSPDSKSRQSGLLTGPCLSTPRAVKYAVEGTINGAGSAVDPFGRGPTDLPEIDLTPDAFCLPDRSGVGAPHWRPEVPFTFSSSAQVLSQVDQRRIVLEGICFRVSELVAMGAEIKSVRLSGGLSRAPFVGTALASCLQLPVEQVDESEMTLTGVLHLASGKEMKVPFKMNKIDPLLCGRGRYLREKFGRWKIWMQGVL